MRQRLENVDRALAMTCLDFPSDLQAKAQYLTSSQARNTPGLLDWMFELTKSNMREMYDGCPGWGWDDDKKRDELGHVNSRYTVIGRDAFVHLRYEMEDFLPVVYIYEIQVDARQRGKQLGRKLMETVEGIALLLGFHKVMLTVFANNIGARGFYEALGYEEDDSSPNGIATGYFILSKHMKS